MTTKRVPRDIIEIRRLGWMRRLAAGGAQVSDPNDGDLASLHSTNRS